MMIIICLHSSGLIYFSFTRLDVMEEILSGLTVKRPKPRVIDKLMELGLVNDRKELYKKGRGTKSGSLRIGIKVFVLLNVLKENNSHFDLCNCLLFFLLAVHDIDDSSDDERSDSGSDASSRNSTLKKTKTKKAGRKKGHTEMDRIALKNARRAKTGRAPAGQVTAMLLQVMSSGKYFIKIKYQKLLLALVQCYDTIFLHCSQT